MDAIQSLTGCTFGKGNLIHRDYGKNAYTFIRRSDGKAIRIVGRPDAWGEPNPEHQMLFARIRTGEATPDERARFQELHQQRARMVLEMPIERLFNVTPVEPRIPKRARIHDSLKCDHCGEMAMETRTRRFKGQTLCIPCFEAVEAR